MPEEVTCKRCRKTWFLRKDRDILDVMANYEGGFVCPACIKSIPLAYWCEGEYLLRGIPKDKDYKVNPFLEMLDNGVNSEKIKCPDGIPVSFFDDPSTEKKMFIQHGKFNIFAAVYGFTINEDKSLIYYACDIKDFIWKHKKVNHNITMDVDFYMLPEQFVDDGFECKKFEHFILGIKQGG